MTIRAEDLALFLQRRREAAGFTQETAANHLGISLDSYQRIENGTNLINVERFFNYLEFFGCDIRIRIVTNMRLPYQESVE
jgi:transcriptional regulator with XRE-family HTH domain